MIKKLFFSTIVLLFLSIDISAQQVNTIKTNSTKTTINKEVKPKNNVIFTTKLNQPKAFVHENSPKQKKTKQIGVKPKAIQKKEQ